MALGKQFEQQHSSLSVTFENWCMTCRNPAARHLINPLSERAVEMSLHTYYLRIYLLTVRCDEQSLNNCCEDEEFCRCELRKAIFM